MKHLFIGLLYDKDREAELLKKIGYLQPQINQYEWGFLKGLEENLGYKPDVIASLPTGSFPKNSKKLFIKGKDAGYTESVKYLGFINFYFLRETIRKISFRKSTFRYLDNQKEKTNIYVYSMYYPFMTLIKDVKRKYKDRVNIVLIVPDLVGKYTFQYKSKLKNAYHSRHAKKQYEYAKLADQYVLLTEAMKDVLEIGDKPYTVIEGFLPSLEIPKVTIPDELKDKKIVMYAGSLNPAFGIEELLKQFITIEDANYELWLCGQEEYAGYIREYSKKDPRIKYLGFLPKAKILELQQQATMLINPRRPEGEYTKYSFPSKTMEYILSGKPVLMYRLKGIPKEYAEYLVYFDEADSNSIAKVIREVGEWTPQQTESLKNSAKKFSLKKNPQLQVRKVFEIG